MTQPLDIGEIQLAQRPAPKTLGEAAKRSVDDALERVMVGLVDLRGAIDRQRILEAAGMQDRQIDVGGKDQ